MEGLQETLWNKNNRHEYHRIMEHPSGMDNGSFSLSLMGGSKKMMRFYGHDNHKQWCWTYMGSLMTNQQLAPLRQSGHETSRWATNRDVPTGYSQRQLDSTNQATTWPNIYQFKHIQMYSDVFTLSCFTWTLNWTVSLVQCNTWMLNWMQQNWMQVQVQT